MKTSLPGCDRVYFAALSQAELTHTADSERREGDNSQRVQFKGERIANVATSKPGDKILRAYGGGRPYRPLFAATVAWAANPVQGPKHAFDVFTYIDEGCGTACEIPITPPIPHREIRKDRN